MAHSLKTQIVDLMDEFEKSRQSWQTFNALNAPKKAPFSLRLYKKRRPVQVDFVADKENNTTVPVIRRPIESAWQITDSKSLLSYCSDWVKSLFFDKAELRALPGTGTILIILPHGNLRFVQFIYKDTPIHPTQQAFQEKISPVEVSIFRDFKSFRDWMYDQISHAWLHLTQKVPLSRLVLGNFPSLILKSTYEKDLKMSSSLKKITSRWDADTTTYQPTQAHSQLIRN